MGHAAVSHSTHTGAEAVTDVRSPTSGLGIDPLNVYPQKILEKVLLGLGSVTRTPPAINGVLILRPLEVLGSETMSGL